MTALNTYVRRAALSPDPDRFPAVLDRFLEVLHERGVVNETALFEVLEVLVMGTPLSREHLIAIFGVLPIYQLMTTRDETARQLVREAADLLTNPEPTVSLREWVRAAEHIVGPISRVIAGESI
jgi:hypothetical protein